MAFSRTPLAAAIALSLGLSAPAAAQEEDAEERNPWFVRGSYLPGIVLSTTRFVEADNEAGLPIDRAQAFKLELGWQTNGDSDWERRYRLPSMGVGFQRTEFRNGSELGSPSALYGWFSWPFASLGERVELTSDINFGAAFGWTPFDLETNPFNDAITTSVTFYTEWGFFTRIALSERLSLRAGGAFTHYSNGGTGDPNGAVNIVSPVVGLRYDFARSRLGRSELAPTAPVPGYWELSVLGGGGFKSIDLARGNLDMEEGRRELRRFGAGGVSFELSRRVHAMSKLGGGVDAIYDGSANATLQEDAAVSSSDKLAFGLYAGYEQVIQRFSIPVQIGYYVARGREDERVPALYQKIGFKLDLGSRVFAGLDARFFDFSRADFVRVIVGLRLGRFGVSAVDDE